jgi:hypothetical protein
LAATSVSEIVLLSKAGESRTAHTPQIKDEDTLNANSPEITHEISEVSAIDFSSSIQTLIMPGQVTSTMAYSQATETAASKPVPLVGTSIREIQSIAKALQSSTTQFLSSIPNQSTQLALMRFMDSILSSASKIESLCGSLVTTGVIGQFIFFPKLAIELRLKIWKLALPGPRIIEVHLTEAFRRPPGRWMEEIQAKNPPLALFHVNREAREVASKKYMLLCRDGGNRPYFCHAHFDPDKDIVFFPWSLPRWDNYQNYFVDGDWWSENARTKVQYLAIDLQMWDRESHLLKWSFFTALKEFTIVVHGRGEGESECDSDKYVEVWRMNDTRLAFEEPWEMGLNEVDPGHKLFIEQWYDIVLEKMEEELELAELNNIEWSIPKINVKILTRNGARCCRRDDWGR